MDYSEGSENLNQVFGDCLVKYIDILGRKGCCRTGLEFSKLLLGLSPKTDLLEHYLESIILQLELKNFIIYFI